MITDGVEFNGHRNPQIAEVPDGHEHQLGVGDRLSLPQNLKSELVKLPEPPGLRPLVAEHGTRIPELNRLRKIDHPVRGVGPRAGGWGLGQKRERLPALIDERKHLLLHDVSLFAHSANEQLSFLDYRRLNPLVTVSPGDRDGWN